MVRSQILRLTNTINRVVNSLINPLSAPRRTPDESCATALAETGIRAANLDDVSAVLPMAQKSCTLHQQWDSAKFGLVDNFTSRYRNWLSDLVDDPRSIFLVAPIDGRLVGFLVGTVDRGVPLHRLAEFGYVRDLWVEEDYRRTGIGQSLVHAAIKQFALFGLKQIRLETAAVNEPARAFFSTCGFRPSAIEMLIER